MKLLLVLKKLVLPAAITYTIALIVANFINPPELPDIGFSFQDKLFHFLAYFILANLWILYVRLYAYKKGIIWAFIFALCLGVILEILQNKVNPNRTFDTNDMLANAIGVIVGTYIAIKLKLVNYLGASS